MAFDYQSALKSGASEDQVLDYLNKTRGYDVQGAVKAGATKSQVIDYLAKTQPQQNNSGEETKSTGILADAYKTLIAKPAVRLGQAVGAVGLKGVNSLTGGALDKYTPEGDLNLALDRSLSKPVNAPVLNSGKTVEIEPQKTNAREAVPQLFSDALKSASYLAPGYVAGATLGPATSLLGNTAGRIASGALAGGSSGYAVDVAQNMDSGKNGGEAFVPGFATLIGGATGGLLEAGGVGVEKLSQGAQSLGKELEQQSFKLTPAQKTKLGSKLDDLTKFASDNIPAGSAEQRFVYADDLYQHYEEQLQKALSSGAESKVSVGRDKFISELENIKDNYKYDRDFETINKQIDGAISTIKKQYPEGLIPIDKLNVFKRSTYQNAYNKAGDKVLDTVEHDIGDKARVEIEKAAEKAGLTVGDLKIGDFNKEYGNLIQLRKILKLAQNRPELGFTKRITSRIVGGIIGNALGGIPGLIGGELLAEPITNKIAGTTAKTGIAKKLMNVQPKKVGSIIQRLR